MAGRRKSARGAGSSKPKSAAARGKTIVREISFGRGNRSYFPGDEAELAKVLSPKDADRLLAKGAITGKWGRSSAAEEVVEDESTAAAGEGGQSE